MENLIVKNPPEFTSEIHKTEKKEFITADLENEIKSALLNNDVFLKVLAEAIQKKAEEHIKDGNIHVTSQDKENWSGKAGTAVATQEADGLESAADKRKLDGMAAGAEVNQYAFSRINVGDLKVTANEKTSTIVLQAGSNITISADNASKKIIITSNKDGGNADKLDGYHAEHFAAADHGHDGRYYTKTESDNLLNGKANSNHNHNGSKYLAGQGTNGGYSFTNDGLEDTGMFSDADGDLYFMQNGTKWYASHSDHTHDIAWGNVSGKPSSYPPSSHSHDNYLSTSGGTLAGNLNLQPPSGEGGQLELRAASNTPDVTGITLDTLNGDFRIFGIASTKQGGVGSVIYINPYRKTVHADDYDCHTRSVTTHGLGDIDVAFDTGTSSGGYRTTVTPAEIMTNSLRLSSKDGDTLHLCTALEGSTLYESDCQSVCFGYKAGNMNGVKTFRDNICLGYKSLLSYEIGALDVAIGCFAGYNFRKPDQNDNDPDYDETFNVFLGSYAGASVYYGSENVFLGYEAGNYSSKILNHCTLIGGVASAGGGTGETVNSTALGHNATVTGDNQVQLGDSSTSVYAYSALNNRSDKRDKIDIRDTQLGLDFLLKHRPVEFRWDLREAYQDVKKTKVKDPKTGKERIKKELVFIPKDGSRSGKRFHEGFIAQEVEAIMEEMGVDFAGLQNHNISGGADRYTIGYTEYIPIIVKAIQELKQMYDEEIKHLKEEIVLLKNKKVV